MKTSILKTIAVIGVSSGLLTAAYGQAAPAQAPDSQPVTAQPVQIDSNGVVVMAPYSVSSDIPRPIETVPVNVGPEHAGQQVDMLFRVDENGQAYNIDADTTNMPDRYFNIKTASLVTQLRVAIQGWQFEPARDPDGRAVDRLVRLPVNLGS